MTNKTESQLDEMLIILRKAFTFRATMSMDKIHHPGPEAEKIHYIVTKLATSFKGELIKCAEESRTWWPEELENRNVCSSDFTGELVVMNAAEYRRLVFMAREVQSDVKNSNMEANAVMWDDTS